MRILVVAAILGVLFESSTSFTPSNARRLSNAVSSKQLAPVHMHSAFLRMAVTDAPVKLDASPMSGMFTNTSPESRRVKPVNYDGKTKFKIVYVVLESQYQSALTKACNSINGGKESVAVEAVGYLLEELRNPSVFEQFKADVADANIFIGSLIFVEELADKVCQNFKCLVFFQFLWPLTSPENSPGCRSCVSPERSPGRCPRFPLNA